MSALFYQYIKESGMDWWKCYSSIPNVFKVASFTSQYPDGIINSYRASTICLTGTGQGVGHGGLVQGSERGSEAIQAGQVCVQVRRLQANVTEKLLRLLVEGKTAVVAAAAATTAAGLAARAVAAA